MYECIIVGCGPAGLSAAIYLGRAKLGVLMIGKVSKSQVRLAHKIDNYFGFPEGIAGKDLLDKGVKQVKKFRVPIINKEVVSVVKKGNNFNVKTEDEGEFLTKSLIIATGTPFRLSGIKNEENLIGKGVHYCVECDGAFYKDKKVALIGNGNRAAEDAIDLLMYTKNVNLISNADNFKLSEVYQKAIKKRKIKLTNIKILEFVGKNKFEYLMTDGDDKLAFDGVFMACGTLGALGFANKLGLEIKDNILKVDENCMTNIKGVFAAGNCISSCRQIAKSVGDGCNAGLNVIKYIKKKEIYVDYSK